MLLLIICKYVHVLFSVIQIGKVSELNVGLFINAFGHMVGKGCVCVTIHCLD